MLTTPDELASLIKKMAGVDEKKDTSQYRYVIYVRKSTDEKDRQVRSLSDQIDECRDLAKRAELKVISKPIQEAESAKEPDIRPKFRQMLDAIKQGKFEGIISWHPDRLARNMKDAGEIIDLLDKQIIKDLRFCSFIFENNSSGKMLLGIAFVLSKQYSDKLSDDVKRGMRRSIEEGKWFKTKHGYYKDRNQFLRPDGDYFVLMKNAWRLRLENKRLDDIAKYLNDNKYAVPTGTGNSNHKPYLMDKKRLSELFRDAFYTGVQKYGETVVNLTELYDFIPMITVEDFLKINRFSDIKKAIVQRKRGYEGDYIADLMRRRVICGYCDEPMTVGVTRKYNKSNQKLYFYYRCDNQKCKFYGKSVRAQVIVNFVKKYLDENRFTSREIYDHYIGEMRHVIEQKQQELESQRRTLTIEGNKCEKDIEKIKQLLLDIDDQFIKKEYMKELKGKYAELKAISEAIAKIKEELGKSKQAILSYEEFLELFKSLPDRVRQITNLKELDFVLGKIFLNFTVKDKEVLSYRLNSPFKEFVEKGFVVSSRPS